MGEEELTTLRNSARYSRLMLGAPAIYKGIIPTIIDYRAHICAELANDTKSLAIMSFQLISIFIAYSKNYKLYSRTHIPRFFVSTQFEVKK